MNKPIKIETTALCSYGCGTTAQYVTKSGNFICAESPNKCPINRQKNSKGLKKVMIPESGSHRQKYIKNYPKKPKIGWPTIEAKYW